MSPGPLDPSGGAPGGAPPPERPEATSGGRETVTAVAIAIGVVVLALAGGVWLGRLGDRGPSGSLRLAAPAPGFSLPVVAGEGARSGDRIDLQTYRGTPVILDFWAGWCKPCEILAPILTELAQAGERGDGPQVVVLGVSAEPRASPAAIAADHARFGSGYPSVRATPELLTAYGVQSLPLVVLIGPDGVVRRTWTGVPSRSTLLEAIAALPSVTPEDG